MEKNLKEETLRNDLLKNVILFLVDFWYQYCFCWEVSKEEEEGEENYVLLNINFGVGVTAIICVLTVCGHYQYLYPDMSLLS